MIRRLFSLSFYSKDVNAQNDLYFRSFGDVCLEEDKLVFGQNAQASFDTFFNCFSFSKYKQYTNLTQTSLQLDLVGQFNIEVYSRVVTQKYDKQYKDGDDFDTTPLSLNKYTTDSLLFSQQLDSGKQNVVIDFKDLQGEGYIYFRLTCLSQKGVLACGQYEATVDAINSPKVAIGICTFKRESYVLGNLKRVGEFLQNKPEYKDILGVYVIDNGQTLGEHNEFDFAKILPNKNLGGSGGFTRAIIEIANSKKFTHFLLMDDDIVFDTVILQKLFGLLAYAKDIDNLAVGGGMMMLGSFNRQYEFGASWKGDKLHPFNRNYNIADPAFVALNECELKPDYNAWWFCCMPVSATKKGLPLPLFIKGDDIEYGLRWQGDILLINGLSVWHEDFDLKYSGELEYYIKRNEMIVNVLNCPDKGAWFHVKKLIRATASQLISQRYDVAGLVFKAYNDFLQGPNFLFNTDGDKLHQELRSLAPKQYSGAQLKEMGYDVNRDYYIPSPKNKKLRQTLTLNGYLIPNCFYNKCERKEGRLVRLTRTKPRYFYKSAVTIQYNRTPDRGFVTKQSRLKMVAIGFKLFGMCIKTLFKFGKAKKQYKQQFAKLTSLDNWQNLLEKDFSNYKI